MHRALGGHVEKEYKGGASGSSGGVISEREKLSLALTLGSVTLQTFYMHKVICNTIWDRENPKKDNRSSLSHLNNQPMLLFSSYSLI